MTLESNSSDTTADGSGRAKPWRCVVFGHRLAFGAHDRTMVWECERGCGIIGSKVYPSIAQARHYAAGFDRRDSDDLGRRAPLIGLFPLRMWHKFRQRG